MTGFELFQISIIQPALASLAKSDVVRLANEQHIGEMRHNSASDVVSSFALIITNNLQDLQDGDLDERQFLSSNTLHSKRFN